MPRIQKLFPDGGSLSLSFSGVGDAPIIISADPNEDIDRNITVTVESTQGDVRCSESVTVRQTGSRELLLDCNGDTIHDSDNLFLKSLKSF